MSDFLRNIILGYVKNQLSEYSEYLPINTYNIFISLLNVKIIQKGDKYFF